MLPSSEPRQRLVFVQELVESAHDIGYDATVHYLLPMVQNLASDPEVLVRQSLMQHFGDLAGHNTSKETLPEAFLEAF